MHREGNFGAGAKLSDYYGINAMINSDEPLLSIPVKYTDADFGGGVIRFEFSDKISDEQKASAVIMQFDEDSTFTKLESFVDEKWHFCEYHHGWRLHGHRQLCL